MASPLTAEPLSQNRRSGHRHKLRTLAYIKLESGDSGVLRDIGENGIAVQVLSRLDRDHPIHIRLDLPHPRFRFDAECRVVWVDSLGQAGLEFVGLEPRSQRLLKDWLFTQVLADAHRAAGDDAGELLFSTAPHAAIRLEPRRFRESSGIRLLWFNVSAPRFARLVDGIALLCAVLLFSLLTLFLTDILPSWPITIAFLLGTAVVFAGVYWFVFAVWFGITPGNRLAELARLETPKSAPKLARPRFR